MADSSFAITAGTGTPIDITTVTTGAGIVDRQTISIGDAVTGANRMKIDAFGNAYMLQGPYAVTSVTTASATVCLGPTGAAAKYLVAVINNSNASQTVTLTGYDNASAASGTQVCNVGQLGGTQIITFPAPGIPLTNGFVALASAVPSGAGIQICVR